MQQRAKKVVGAGFTLGVVVAGLFLFSGTGNGLVVPVTSFQENSLLDKEALSNQLGTAIRGNEFPETYTFTIGSEPKQAKVQYTLDDALQAQMSKLMGQYKPDYGAFVALDARTGRILSMVSYSNRSKSENLTLRATFPSASIFKVVTASAAIDLNKASPDTVVPFNGGLHTLYKRNVESQKETRWTTRMTMREAFARSVNVFFSKLGLFYVGPRNLALYAERFLFNHPIRADVPVQSGHAYISNDDPWSVAEAASGYTRINTMSPVQGALIAAAVANDGVMMEPFVVEQLFDEKGETIYRGQPRQASVVIEPQSAEPLRELFQQTVRSGTSRRSFRQVVRRRSYDEVEFGGKTGSLMGMDPKGKCDWFVGYARYRDRRVAVAALTVNEKKWKVKSSVLAKLFFQGYLKEVKANESIADAR